MASNATAILIIVLLSVLGFAAIALLTLGVRGRWRRCEPRCATCGQMVGRHEVVDAKRCPECGHDLASIGGVRFFERRLRPLLIVLGLVLFVLALAAPAAAAIVIRQSSVPRKFTQRPTSELLDLLHGPPSSDRTWMLVELAQRAQPMAAGVGANGPGARTPLTRADFERFLDLVESLKASDPLLFDPQLATLLALANDQRLLTGERMRRIADAWFPTNQVVSMRPIVRRGTTLTLAGRGHDVPGALPIECHAWIQAPAIDGAPIRPIGAPIDEASWIPLGSSTLLPVTAEPGSHRLAARLRRELHFAGHASRGNRPPSPGAAPNTGTGVLFADEATIEIPFEVIAEHAPSFLPLESPPSMRSAVRSACRVGEVAIDHTSNPAVCVVHGSVHVDAVKDLRMSFDVVVVVDGREVPLGSIMTHGHAKGSSSVTALGAGQMPWPDPVPTTVSVIFRPAPKYAETEHGAISVWGEPIEIKDVPVRSTRRRAGAEGSP